MPSNLADTHYCGDTYLFAYCSLFFAYCGGYTLLWWVIVFDVEVFFACCGGYCEYCGGVFTYCGGYALLWWVIMLDVMGYYA